MKLKNKIEELKKEIENFGERTGEFICPVCNESFGKDNKEAIIHNKKTGHMGDYNCYYPQIHIGNLDILQEKLQAYQEAQKLMDETLNDFCEDLKEDLGYNSVGYTKEMRKDFDEIIDKLKQKHGAKG